MEVEEKFEGMKRDDRSVCFTDLRNAVESTRELIDLAEGELVYNTEKRVSKEEAKEKLEEFHEDPGMCPQFNVEIDDGNRRLTLYLECFVPVDRHGGSFYILTLA